MPAEQRCIDADCLRMQLAASSLGDRIRRAIILCRQAAYAGRSEGVSREIDCEVPVLEEAAWCADRGWTDSAQALLEVCLFEAPRSPEADRQMWLVRVAGHAALDLCSAAANPIRTVQRRTP